MFGPLLRVRFLWLPAVGLLFGASLAVAGGVLTDGVGSGGAVVVAGFVVTAGVLLAGLARSLLR